MSTYPSSCSKPLRLTNQVRGKNQPADVLPIVLMQACLHEFSWLRLGDNFPDRCRFDRWAKQRTSAELSLIQQQEFYGYKPLGPSGMLMCLHS